MEEIWERARQAAGPKTLCYQLLGNHDDRLIKRVMDSMPEAERFLDHSRELWRFKGVKTQESSRDELILDGVWYMHGYRQHGDHVKYNLMSTVVGHLHTGGVVFMRLRGKVLFELNCGHLANERAVPLSYTAQKRHSKWTTGIGVIDGEGPRFIPIKG